VKGRAGPGRGQGGVPTHAGGVSRTRSHRGGRLLGGRRVRFERRPYTSRLMSYRLAGALVGLLVTLAAGPLYTQRSGGSFYSELWTGTFGSVYGIETVLIIATPLILTGLAAAIPYRMGLWNIGGDGQMYMGAWVAGAIAFHWPHASGRLLIPAMIVGAAIGGGLWILLPALARAYLGVNEIITTLMLNFVGLSWLTYWSAGPWIQPNLAGGVLSKFIPNQSELVPVSIGPISIQWGFLIAVALGVAVWLALRYTRIAYELSIMRAGERTGQYAGIATRRRMVQVLLVGGAMGGLAGAIEMMGNVHQYTPALSNNTGYSGVAVAILAAGSELGVLVIGILFAGVIVGSGVLMTVNVSSGAATQLFGVVLLCAAIGDSLARFRVSLEAPHPHDVPTPAPIPAIDTVPAQDAEAKR
jgi:general nucleoside transport system permease protein